MEGPRAPSNSEFQNVVKFLDDNLRTESTWSVADEYPTTVTMQNLQNFRIITEDHQILSHALLKPTTIKTRRALFKVGCLGSVVTNEKYRNQGLSQTILKDCLRSATEQGCDIAILWTDMYDFYRKLGFELGGSEVSLIIDRPLPVIAGNLKIIESTKVDPQALYRLYAQHSVCSIRGLEDFEKYLKIPNSRLYSAWSTDGKMEAYAVEGKGADLQGYIHEWGGNVEGIVALIAHIRKAATKPVTVISPSHAQALIRRLEQLGVKKVEGFLGMIKMTNPQNLFAKVVRNAKQEWGINLTLELKDGFYYYGIGKDLFKTDSEGDIVRLLFGPTKPSQVHDSGPEVNAALDRMLPLEMWVWGWDSV